MTEHIDPATIAAKDPTVHVVTWQNYVQGVFDSAESAQAYLDHRWPEETRYGVQVTDWKMNTGAFDTRVIPPEGGKP